MRGFLLAAITALLSVVPLSSAAATTLISLALGGAASNANSFVYSSGTVNFTVVGRTFSALPATLNSLSQLSGTGIQVRRTLAGLGVNGGASAEQLDTNQAGRREGLLVLIDQPAALAGMQLSFVDNDDTLQVYGVSGTQLVSLGYPGVIRSGLTGPNAALSLLAGQASGPAFQSGLNSGTQLLSLVNPTARFNAFFFTSREPGNLSYLGGQGQGYRIDTLSFEVVPEPASWWLLIIGFGMTGAVLRQRGAVRLNGR